ncbi:sodium/potassium/calcium exchanger 2-like [Diadema setosum]|uniref:sodium/potassium/calcium exchanger 2-like n=1 Tax=Diadema setosum TaxID=31175 RepID=UPI003B3A7618
MKPISRYMNRRTRWARILGLCSVIVIGCVYMSPTFSGLEQIFRNSHPASEIPRLKLDNVPCGSSRRHVAGERHLLQVSSTTDEGVKTTVNSLEKESNDSGGIYPRDLFTLEQKKQGACILHIFGMIYMFVALAIVCDEFFVPALGIITDKLNLSDDVAGATFMAAGGSAPELFTSLIGVFLARSDVGIGTIVGSAVFNILFVIGMCATFSRGVLSLTWWPLFRDCLFYSTSLALLLIFFNDTVIHWYESLCLLSIYFFYVLFMKFNVQVERWVKSHLLKKKVSAMKQVARSLPLSNDRRVSLPHFRNNASVFRHGALQLMLHTLDPLSESDIVVQDKAIQMNSMAKRQRSSLVHPTGNGKDASQPQNEQSSSRPESARSNQKLTISYHNGYVNGDVITDEPTQITTVSQACDSPLGSQTPNGVASNEEPANGQHPNSVDAQITDSESKTPPANSEAEHTNTNGVGEGAEKNNGVQITVNGGQNNGLNGGAVANGVEQKFEKSTEQLTPAGAPYHVEDGGMHDGPDMADMEVEEPLDISWPSGWRKQVTYVLLAPLVYLLYFTLPDVRKPGSRKWYPVTFSGSIFWIAGFSYLMVWWAKEVGDTIGITEQVMGITILAAGTSIPDLITSVIVARKGLGDMAVSSSVGSNIFDITVGLPMPWLLWSIINGGQAATVDSKGLFCSILLLFGMLLLVIITIAANRWRMTKMMGGCMFLLYIAFLTITLLILFNFVPCVIGS